MTHEAFVACPEHLHPLAANPRAYRWRVQAWALLSKFANWYVPRFNAWSHPLRRADEFEADAAGRVTSPQAQSQALCALVVRDSALDKLHWDVLTASMAAPPPPPTDAISRLLPLAKSARLDEASEAAQLATALAADPDPFDTHPTLPERLAALGQTAGVPTPPATSAAEVWFGNSLPILAAEFDMVWAFEREDIWQERHQFLSTQQQRLHTLNAHLAAGESLMPDEAWGRADLTEDHAGPAEALPLFRALFQDAQHGLRAKFAVGRILTAQDDPAGLALLEDVMALVPATRPAGLALLQAYHQRRGNKAEVRCLQAEALRYADLNDRARAERSVLRSADRFMPHGLPVPALVPCATSWRPVPPPCAAPGCCASTCCILLSFPSTCWWWSCRCPRAGGRPSPSTRRCYSSWARSWRCPAKASWYR